MAGSAPCPHCRFEIPEWSEVCGHCRSPVDWYGGSAYTPEEAQIKYEYADMVASKWPWIPHLLLAVALTVWIAVENPDSTTHDIKYYIGTKIFLFAVDVFLTALPIGMFMWAYVRIKYPNTSEG